MPQNKHKKKKQASSNFSHLSLTDRVFIQSGINEGKSIHKIAEELQKSPSTISREISNRTRYYEAKGNDCVNNDKCKERYVCGDTKCPAPCRYCSICTKGYCDNYIQAQCKKRLKSHLFLCNRCKDFKNCYHFKIRYEADYAHTMYEKIKTESREGFNLTNEEFTHINNIVSPLIMKGLSPYAIKSQLGDSLFVSEATLRRLVNKCELDARNIDLRNQTKRKPRKSNRRQMKNEIVSISKIGHLYSDFKNLMNKNDCFYCQMDCVEGKKTDSKTLLTLHFPALHFQLAFIMQSHTSKSVIETLDNLEHKLGRELYSSLFSIILTDNGHEFLDINSMERSVFEGKRTSIYFCEPHHAEHKAECESNHRLIRYIIPKGTSFQNLTQRDVTKAINHINSYPRQSLQGLTPYRMAKMVFPQIFFDVLKLEEIPFDNLEMKPTLLKK